MAYPKTGVTRLYRQQGTGSVTNTTSQTFSPKDPHDTRYVLFIVTGSIEDSTSAPTTIAFGKLIGSDFTVLEEWSSLSAGIAKAIDKPHHFLAGEEPAFRVEGGTSGDTIVMYLEGYEQEIGLW